MTTDNKMTLEEVRDRLREWDHGMNDNAYAELADAIEAHLSNSETPVAWMYPSDLKRFEESEAIGDAFSVRVGKEDEETVPLYTHPSANVEGDVVVTKNEDGQIVTVTRQNSDGEILSVVAESDARSSADAKDAKVTELVAAAKYYFDRYCLDEANDWFDDGESVGENTGCTLRQHETANRLRDAITAMLEPPSDE